MEVKILCMGENRNYYELDVTSGRIKENIHELLTNKDNPLYILKKDNKSLPFSIFENYGGSMPLKKVSSTTPDAIYKLFLEAKEKAEKHQADYVLVQEFKQEESHFSSVVTGLVQLLVEK